MKFNDNDLVGFPYQVTVGKRGVEGGTVEVKDRAAGEKTEYAIDEVVAKLTATIEAERAKYAFTE